MIKLVVSDMDGTLLKKGEKFISDSITDIICNIKSKDIAFAIASGRQYNELDLITKGMRDIYYICSDGGCIIYNNEVIYKKEIDKDSLRNLECNENVFFHSPFETSKGYLKGDVVKVSARGGGFFETPFGTYEVYRDKEWREWIKNDAGKGQAVEYLQKRLNISVNETAAFGDNFNDMGMFRKAGERYCMRCSPSQVKMLCNNTVDDIEKSLSEIGGK